MPKPAQSHLETGLLFDEKDKMFLDCRGLAWMQTGEPRRLIWSSDHSRGGTRGLFLL